MRSLVVMIIGAILLWSGIIHAAQPYLFAQSISSYQISPMWLTSIATLVLPYLHMFIAACLFSNTQKQFALFASAFLFALYATAQTWVVIMGIETSCGCFGYGVSLITPASAAVPWGLMLASLILWLLDSGCDWKTVSGLSVWRLRSSAG